MFTVHVATHIILTLIVCIFCVREYLCDKRFVILLHNTRRYCYILHCGHAGQSHRICYRKGKGFGDGSPPVGSKATPKVAS